MISPSRGWLEQLSYRTDVCHLFTLCTAERYTYGTKISERVVGLKFSA